MRNKTASRKSALALVAAVSAVSWSLVNQGCGHPNGSSSTPRFTSYAAPSIIGGHVPEADNPGTTSAVALLKVDRNKRGEVTSSHSICTATLIAPPCW